MLILIIAASSHLANYLERCHQDIAAFTLDCTAVFDKIIMVYTPPEPAPTPGPVPGPMPDPSPTPMPDPTPMPQPGPGPDIPTTPI